MVDTKCRSPVVLRRSRRLLDQLGPRRSARLSGITVPKTTSLPPRKTRTRDPSRKLTVYRETSQCSRDPPRSLTVYLAGPCPIHVDRGGADYLDKLRRITRQANARYFWLAYEYVYSNLSVGLLNIKGTNSESYYCVNLSLFLLFAELFLFCDLFSCIHDMEELRYLVLSDHITCERYDQSHGVMSVSVHGGSYICTVFKNRIPDMRAIDMLRGPQVLEFFGLHVLSHMEDLADSDAIVRKKPFAVVSVTRESENVYEENLYKAEDKAKDFLQGKMNSDSALTKEETIKTAIAGFHYLFKKKLQPKEIWVTGFHDDGINDHSWILSTKDIGKYLIDIDKTDEELIRHQQV